MTFFVDGMFSSVAGNIFTTIGVDIYYSHLFTLCFFVFKISKLQMSLNPIKQETEGKKNIRSCKLKNHACGHSNL